MKTHVIALDQGTTSSRAIVFDRQGQQVAISQKPFAQIYPHPGWVEHDPEVIFQTQAQSLAEAFVQSGLDASDIAGIGITNQRETTIVWNKHTGEPVYNAIVWQCRRTASLCEDLKAQGMEPVIKEKTGLVLDAYFSATKIKWILDNVPGAKESAQKGDLLFGTIETWIIWNLTGGKVHVTDYSNASRTMLFNIHKCDWDEDLCNALDIPMTMLPKPVENAGDFGVIASGVPGLEKLVGVPICAALGDQQAALLGQGCLCQGDAKNTYGTGCFTVMNVGSEPISSQSGLLTSIAWSINNQVQYCLEGSVFNAGSTMQWLRDEVGLIRDAAESEALAMSVPDNGGVYLVSAFTGLGAPHWDMYARGVITGLTRGANRAHIVRAGLEGIAYQVRDLILAMEKDSSLPMSCLRVDGGAAKNSFLMQFQADILHCSIQRPDMVETTALGAAFLAGYQAGVWKELEDVRKLGTGNTMFYPNMETETAEKLCNGWNKAVQRAYAWE